MYSKLVSSFNSLLTEYTCHCLLTPAPSDPSSSAFQNGISQRNSLCSSFSQSSRPATKSLRLLGETNKHELQSRDTSRIHLRRSVAEAQSLLKAAIFWDVALCSLVETYGRSQMLIASIIRALIAELMERAPVLKHVGSKELIHGRHKAQIPNKMEARVLQNIICSSLLLATLPVSIFFYFLSPLASPFSPLSCHIFSSFLSH